MEQGFGGGMIVEKKEERDLLDLEQVESLASQYKTESHEVYEERIAKLMALQKVYGVDAVAAYAPTHLLASEETQEVLLKFMDEYQTTRGPEALKSYLGAAYSLKELNDFLLDYLASQEEGCQHDCHVLLTELNKRYQDYLIKPIKNLTKVTTFKEENEYGELVDRTIREDRPIDEKLFLEFSDTGVEFQIFCSFLSVVKEQGISLSLEDVEGLRVKQLSGPELLDSKNSQTRAMMERLYEEVYANKEDQEFRDTLLKKFAERLANSETKCYMVTKHFKSVDDDALIMFCCMTPEWKGRPYWSALNSNRGQFAGIAPTKVFLQHVIVERHGEDVIDGDCDPNASGVIGPYIEDLKFVATEFFLYKDKPSVAIVRDPNVDFRSRQFSEEEIAGFIKNGVREPLPDMLVARFEGDHPLEPLKFGYVLTRYITRLNDEKIRKPFLVFEKNHGVTWEARATKGLGQE